MSGDKDKAKPADFNNDARDSRKPETSQKTASEAVADAPRAKRHQENFSSFSHDMKAIGTNDKAVAPLVLEDSTTGEKLYDASMKKQKPAGKAGERLLQMEKELAAKKKNAVITHEFTAYIPDYKTVGTIGGGLPKFVEVHVSPFDNAAIDKRFKENLGKRDESKLSDFDRRKFQNLAICDVMIDKYQDAMTKSELRDAKNVPMPIRGLLLASQALEDGAALGATRSVLHKVIAEDAIGDLASGTAVGLAFGKIVGNLAASVNPVVKGAALAIQGTGVLAGLAQLGKIGQDGIKGLNSAAPKLQELCMNPTEANFVKAKESVDEHLGPPLADTALTALGVAAAHGVEKAMPRSIKGGAHAHGDEHAAHGGEKGSHQEKPHNHEVSAADKLDQKHSRPEPATKDNTQVGSDRRQRKDAQLELPRTPRGDFKVEETHEVVRTLMFDGKTERLMRLPGEGFFSAALDKGKRSPIKVHILTRSAEDLGQLQAALIPEFSKDAVLSAKIGGWKTIDPSFGVKGTGHPDVVAPTGTGQGAKAFTIYTRTAEDALLVQKRLDEICSQKGLSLSDHVKTGNIESVPGSSKRIGICRDTFPVAMKSQRAGYAVESAVEARIMGKRGKNAGEQLSSNELSNLEREAGIKGGTLIYSDDGRLMILPSEVKKYHGGLYAKETAGQTFGDYTDRSAIYSLYRKYGMEPADPRVIEIQKPN